MKIAKKLICLLAAVSMITTLSVCQSKTESTAGYTAGTYEGVGKGVHGDITLEVTFDDKSINSIEVVSHNETAGISDAAFDKIPAAIIENQSLAVDTVSGATLTSNGILEAVGNAVTAAGGDVEALKKAEVRNETGSSETVEKSADVIVVGGGGAGFASAISSAEQGMSVIVIEKNSYIGGNTLRSGGAFSVADAETTGQNDSTKAQDQAVENLLNMEFEREDIRALQAECRKQYDLWKQEHPGKIFDSVEFNTLQLFVRFGQQGIIDQLYEVLSQSKQTKDWLTGYGFNWAEKSHVVVGDNWPRWCTKATKEDLGYVPLLNAAIDKNGYDVEVMKQVSGQKLIVDDNGHVSGVQATGADGTQYTLHAGKGVVLATGGFAANNDMMVEYSDGRWSNLAEIGTTNDPACQGDGIRMALDVHAQLYNMGHVQILPIADPETGSISTIVGATTNMYVNKEGKRFVNESTDRDTLANAIMVQPEACAYIISSSENAGISKEGMTMGGHKIEDLIADGKVLKADTIEDLAAQMGVDPAVLSETVEKFNEAVRNQEDPEFNRTNFGGDLGNLDGTPEIVTAPYYACLRKPAAHITKGGIRITNRCQVLSEEETVIDGLYAAGEVTGDIGPAGILQAMVEGRIVGKTIAEENR